jgi:hypothetical protein
LDVIGTKILRLLLPQSPPLVVYYSPTFGFLGLEDSIAKAESGYKGLALFTLSLCLPLKVALFFILLHFIYTFKYIFPYRDNSYKCIKKDENLTENHTTPIVLNIYYKTINQ